MKKFLAVILSLCMMTVAWAEEAVDLSKYSDDALLLLLQQVQSEIVARKIQKTAQLKAGKYIGGRDIPVGRYVLSATGTDEISGWITLGPEEDPSAKVWSFIWKEEWETYITIEEGDILSMGIPGQLTVYAGLIFE